MSVSSVTGSSALSIQQLLSMNRGGTNQGVDSASNTTSVGKSSGNAFMDSLFETFKDLGIQAPPPPEGASSSQSSTKSSSSSSSSVPEALNAFLQTLFQTLANNPDGSNSTASYQDTETTLQSLIVSLSSSGSSSSETSDLQSAFSALKTAIANQDAAFGQDASSASALSLQTFLQTLLDNLQQNAAVTSVTGSGSLLKTMA